MGTLYKDKEHWCRTCNRRLSVARRVECRSAGHALEVREGKTWRCRYYRGNKVFSVSTGETKKGEAKKFLARREGKIADGIPIATGKVTWEDGVKLVLDDYRANGKRSLDAADRRFTKHLTPFFGGMLLTDITAAHALAYVAKRQADTKVVRAAYTLKSGASVSEYSRDIEGAANASINRELALLKRVFSLATKLGLLHHRPHIAMLRENNVRTGFFEAEQYAAVLRHLPEEVRPVITFAYLTGWRLKSEILPLEWRQVDFAAGEVRLDAGTTKNGDGRVFPMSKELRSLFDALRTAEDARRKAGHVSPWVFVRVVGGKPQRIADFRKAFERACVAAGCPGRILHDFRRTAVRNFVRAGIPERVAMRLTGHLTPSVFHRYNIVSPNDLRDAVARLDGHSGFVRVGTGT